MRVAVHLADHFRSSNSLSNDGAETGDLAKDCDHRIGFGGSSSSTSSNIMKADRLNFPLRRLVGLSVAIFATAVWRLLAILIAWHFNVRVRRPIR